MSLLVTLLVKEIGQGSKFWWKHMVDGVQYWAICHVVTGYSTNRVKYKDSVNKTAEYYIVILVYLMFKCPSWWQTICPLFVDYSSSRAQFSPTASTNPVGTHSARIQRSKWLGGHRDTTTTEHGWVGRWLEWWWSV